MSKLSDGVLKVFAASQKTATNVFTQIKVGRVGRLLQKKSFQGQMGRRGIQFLPTRKPHGRRHIPTIPTTFQQRTVPSAFRLKKTVLLGLEKPTRSFERFGPCQASALSTWTAEPGRAPA
jgi:hypothetical protein